MELACGLVPGPDAVDLACAAEALGYDRVWLYSSAPVWEDTFILLALIAQRTQRIGLGTAVLVPSERTVMSTAAAILTLERLAPGRVVYGFGTGQTARSCLGQPPVRLTVMRQYLTRLRALLRGEVVEIDGRPAQMLHHDGLAAARPVEIPLVLSAFGPKGTKLARDVADGLISPFPSDGSWDRHILFAPGTVLDPGETTDSARAREAVGPWAICGAYHLTYEAAGEAVDQLPGGAEWRAAFEAEVPAERRHLELHRGHVTHLAERDRRLLLDRMPVQGFVGTPGEIDRMAAEAAAAGTTELLFNPAGPDIARELRAFRAAVRTA